MAQRICQNTCFKEKEDEEKGIERLQTLMKTETVEKVKKIKGLRQGVVDTVISFLEKKGGESCE